MTNLEKYNYAFTSNLKVSEDQLPGLKYQGIFEWDSVGHMDIIADIEAAYGIQMDTKDVLDLSSYEKGKVVLAKYGVNFDEQ
ncbi:MAG: acyl carrier protein [Eubacteriales bacterium]|nr:acyl carrier protein [Eubacteriales bacterium]